MNQPTIQSQMTFVQCAEIRTMYSLRLYHLFEALKQAIDHNLESQMFWVNRIQAATDVMISLGFEGSKD